MISSSPFQTGEGPTGLRDPERTSGSPILIKNTFILRQFQLNPQ